MSSKKIDLINLETHSIKWFVDLMKKDQLIIDESFQRQFVWSIKDQVRLMETILLGYSIPELYLWMADTDPDTGDSKYSIVDGQQRISTIRDYINNKFKLNTGYLETEETSFNNKYFSELLPDDKKTIWDYPLATRIIRRDMDKDDIVTMFLRLNSTNLTLNPQELRNAEFNGLFIKLAEELSEENFWVKYDFFTPSQIRRMGDIQFISQILIFFREGITGETTQKSLNEAYDKYNDDYPQYISDRETFKKIISEMEKILLQSEENKQFFTKLTHMYTFMIIIYFVIEKQESIERYLDKINLFIKAYTASNPSKVLEDTNDLKVLSTYKTYVLEGTQSKSKRVLRIRLIKDYLEI